MSFEAIASITKAEADAKAAVAQADAKARQMRADAENAGRAAIEAAGEKAGHEIAELRRQACMLLSTEGMLFASSGAGNAAHEQYRYDTAKMPLFQDKAAYLA